MIKIVEGNILNAKEDIIGHQVNCMGVMGSGLAKQVRNKYPEVYNHYVQTVNWVKEENKRGNIKNDNLLGSCVFSKTNDGKTIANIFGQYSYGRGKQFTNYDVLKKALSSIYENITVGYNNLYGKSVALPYGLSCGLAGGDWNIVYEIIDDVFENYEVTLYRFN